MKISIALCTYNGESFLREQLDSIAWQTLPPDELLVCDDCSNDKTIEILQEFREKFPFPVHIHQNETNLGSTRNFERAISLCSGDIIALCDQDDIWKQQKLERLKTIFQSNPEAGYVFSNAELVDEHLQPLGQFLWDTVRFNGEIKDLFVNGDQLRCFVKLDFVTGATMAFRACIGKMAMPFPTDVHWIHDGWIAMFSSATGQPGIAVDEPLIAYRQHAKQQIGAPDQKGAEKKSLLEMYGELQKNQQFLFAAWEKHCTSILRLKSILTEKHEQSGSPDLKKNIEYLHQFESHFLARRRILTSKGFGRYVLIFREALSGRYPQFSDSWRSFFRDILL